MRTPKRVGPVIRRIYPPEIGRCPRCGESLQLSNSRAGQKTIQTLTGPEWIACRPGRCADPTCEGRQERWKSAEGLQRSPKHSTSGYEGIAQIGGERQVRRDPFGEIWSGLRERGEISESEVRNLSQQGYLPLSAGEEANPPKRLRG